MSEELWYPSVDDVLAIHDHIVAEYPSTESGIRNQGGIDFAIEYVESDLFDDIPNTIHGKTVHLFRLLVANHPFVDRNKRTALNTVATFYFLNGYRFSYDDGITNILKQFASNEAVIENQEVLQYLRSHTEQLALAEAVDKWRDDLLAYGIERLSKELSDPND